VADFSTGATAIVSLLFDAIWTPSPATVLASRLNAALGTQVRTSEAPQAALLAAVDAVLVLLAILAAIGAAIEQIDACAVAELQALELLSCPSRRREGRRRRRWAGDCELACLGMLNLLLGHHLEAREICDAKGG
jgi:hypothetical protein